VVYLPAGTYKISAPLTVQNQEGFSFIGASPAATTIVWAGPVSGTMMLVEASTISNWGRITWEGSGSAAIGVAHSCPPSGCSGGYAPTNLLHFDEVFQDLGKGIVGGLNGVSNNSEVTITRCTFRNCSYAGLSVESYNALDYWVWDSQFLNNAIGMTNNVSGGSFMAYRCLFENSSTADITFSNTEFFSFRDNVSIGSYQFLQGLGYASSAEVNLQGNRIVGTSNIYTVGMLDVGPLILVDNQIQTLSGATGPAVELATPNGNNIAGPELISIGNQYTASNPVTVVSNVLAPGQSPQWWKYEDQIVPYGSISSAAPTMPPLPTQLTTNITDMPVGSSAASIQLAINSATGTNPVIHLPAGNYPINQTITVPANLNIFIVGDNFKTELTRSGLSGPMFELLGPSKATIRDMFLNGGTADGILVLNADQAGARVFGDGLNMTTNRTGDVLADTLANTHVDLQGLESSRGGFVSVKSIGTGSPSASRVGIYGDGMGTAGGVDPTNGCMYEVSNGGRMLVDDAWYESTDSPTVVNLTNSDSGVFCYWNGVIGQGSNGVGAPPGPPVNINGFNGLASFISIIYGLQIGSTVTINPSSQTQALFLGQLGDIPQGAPPSAANYIPYSGPGGAGSVGNVFVENSQAQTYVNSSVGNAETDIPDVPSNPLPAPTPPAFPVSFIDNMLSLARSAADQEVPLTTDMPSGVTDVRLYRLAFDNCGMGLHIAASSTAPTPVPTQSSATSVPTTTAAYTYPQPAQDILNISYPSGSTQQVRVNIYAFSGEEVDTFTANAKSGNGNLATLSVKTFAPGVYFYIIHGLGSGGLEAKGKFLVTH
jgi:hypothetical protein